MGWSVDPAGLSAEKDPPFPGTVCRWGWDMPAADSSEVGPGRCGGPGQVQRAWRGKDRPSAGQVSSAPGRERQPPSLSEGHKSEKKIFNAP